MSAKHTPGPWDTKYGSPFVYGECCTICDCSVSPALSLREKEANARLIAAAPDLLEALQDALLRLNKLLSSEYSDDDLLLFGQIESAIAKATGEGQP